MNSDFDLFREYFSWAANNISKAEDGKYPINLDIQLSEKIGQPISPRLVSYWAEKCENITESELTNVKYIYRIYQIRRKHES